MESDFFLKETFIATVEFFFFFFQDKDLEENLIFTNFM